MVSNLKDIDSIQKYVESSEFKQQFPEFAGGIKNVDFFFHNNPIYADEFNASYNSTFVDAMVEVALQNRIFTNPDPKTIFVSTRSVFQKGIGNVTIDGVPIDFDNIIVNGIRTIMGVRDFFPIYSTRTAIQFGTEVGPLLFRNIELTQCALFTRWWVEGYVLTFK